LQDEDAWETGNITRDEQIVFPEGIKGARYKKSINLLEK